MAGDGQAPPAGDLAEARSSPGWMAPALEAELDGLALRYVVVEAGRRRSPRVVRDRLRLLSNRIGGAEAIVLRQRPVPWAYRVLFRQIGIDPDERPTPIEAAVLERIRRGGFKASNVIDDALTIATVESGLALVAFDADAVSGVPGIRSSAPGERMAGRSWPLVQGSLVIADERRVLGLLFGETAEDVGVTKATARSMIVAVQAPGVPEIVVEEGLWLASEVTRC